MRVCAEAPYVAGQQRIAVTGQAGLEIGACCAVAQRENYTGVIFGTGHTRVMAAESATTDILGRGCE